MKMTLPHVTDEMIRAAHRIYMEAPHGPKNCMHVAGIHAIMNETEGGSNRLHIAADPRDKRQLRKVCERAAAAGKVLTQQAVGALRP
jgi:hypothetical protein